MIVWRDWEGGLMFPEHACLFDSFIYLFFFPPLKPEFISCRRTLPPLAL